MSGLVWLLIIGLYLSVGVLGYFYKAIKLWEDGETESFKEALKWPKETYQWLKYNGWPKINREIFRRVYRIGDE
jgi:hypothetical protein